ncbi:MAG: TonB-dependent receptor [Bacteroidales bacterium]|nr:TonB-dependent receptor [Bacteroidales bacterium]MBN2749086.1 TonB-dependent receptor [Bacteroidales bacterium]
MKFLRLILLAGVIPTYTLSAFSQTITVKDSYTKQGIPNVNIQWQSIKTSTRGGVSTNSKGAANISSKEKRLFVAASCVGYKTLVDTIDITKNPTVFLDEDIFNLSQVTVTGTRTERSLKETPVLTQLISRKDIASIKASTISDILEHEIPSIEINQYGYGAALSSQGLESKYTLVLIDGERMAGETDGNVDFSRINAANVERVEIIKGASSALYGSNAIGSVINIITKKPSKKVEVSADIRYAEPNEKNITKALVDRQDEHHLKSFYRNQDRQNVNGDLSIGIKSHLFYSQSYFGYKSRDAYQLFDTKESVKYYPLLDSTANEGISKSPTSIIGFADLSATNRTGFTGTKWRGESKASYYNHEQFDFERDNKHNLYKNYTVGAYVEHNINSTNTIRLAINRDVYNKYLVLEQLDNRQKNYGNTFNSIRLTYSNEQLTKHNLFAGAEFFSEALESDRFVANQVASHSSTDAVVFMQDEYALTPSITIVGGVRGGYHSAHRLHVSPSVTARLNRGNFSYRLSYARGFRSPTLKELYMNWNHQEMFTIYGDENLKAETSNYYAFSTEYLNINKKISITGYVGYNHIYNKIGGIWTANQTEYHYKNMDEYRVFNAELLARWKVLKPLLLKAGYAYTKVFEEDGITLLSSASPHSLTAQVEYTYTKGWYNLSTNIALKMIGKKEVSEFDEGINNFYLSSYPSYSLWNININQQFRRSYSVSIGVKNLLNYTAPILSFSTTSSVGRRFYVSIGYSF